MYEFQDIIYEEYSPGTAGCFKFNISYDAEGYGDTNTNGALSMSIPCKIGDEAWVIRNYKGTPRPQKGIVSEIYFTDDMELIFVVKHITRGRWMKAVFPTKEAAEEEISRRDVLRHKQLGRR